MSMLCFSPSFFYGLCLKIKENECRGFFFMINSMIKKILGEWLLFCHFICFECVENNGLSHRIVFNSFCSYFNDKTVPLK